MISDRKSRIVDHCHQRRLASAGVAHHADLRAIHVGIGLQIVEDPAVGPRPGAQHAPVVELARLAMVHQADDSLVEARAIVGLHGTGVARHESPSGFEQQLRRIRRIVWHCKPMDNLPRRGGRGVNRNGRSEPPPMITGTFLPCVLAGVTTSASMVTVMAG